MKQFTEDEVKELIRNAWIDGWQEGTEWAPNESFPELENPELVQLREDYVNEVMDEL